VFEFGAYFLMVFEFGALEKVGVAYLICWLVIGC
jgi:hypothetical protein